MVNICIQEGKNSTSGKEIILENLNQQYDSKKYNLLKKIIVKSGMRYYFKRLKNSHQTFENKR